MNGSTSQTTGAKPQKPPGRWGKRLLWAAVALNVLLIAGIVWFVVPSQGLHAAKAQEAQRAEAAALAREQEAQRVATTAPLTRAQEGQRLAAQALGTSVITKIDLGGGVTLELALIPSGEFIMGSSANKEDRFDNETQHRVRIGKPFMMGVHPVTQAQWQAVMGNNPSDFKGAQRPVEQVSWDDALAFCRKLGEKDGKKYRLPTEAEWEYACRAGTTTAYYTGDGEQALAEAGWYCGNSHLEPHPVGQKKPNVWGLYDMHGNVCEWCSDWYAEYPAGDAIDPTGPNTGMLRVLRGGSWFYYPKRCRAAFRSAYEPDVRGSIIGFRVALDFH